MIDINKTYKTRNGHKVRIYCMDGGGESPVHGAIFDSSLGFWLIRKWTKSGEQLMSSSSCQNLIEVTPTIEKTIWLNMYNGSMTSGMHATREAADDCAFEGRTGCIKVQLSITTSVIKDQSS